MDASLLAFGALSGRDRGRRRHAQFKAQFQSFLDGLTNRNADDDRSRGKRHLARKFDRKPLADIDLAAVMEWIDEPRAMRDSISETQRFASAFVAARPCRPF